MSDVWRIRMLRWMRLANTALVRIMQTSGLRQGLAAMQAMRRSMRHLLGAWQTLVRRLRVGAREWARTPVCQSLQERSAEQRSRVRRPTGPAGPRGHTRTMGEVRPC